MVAASEEDVVVGCIGAAYGIKGWVKLRSYTDPIDNIGSYKDFYFTRRGKREMLRLNQIKAHGKGLIAQIDGVDDRTAAETYTGLELSVASEQLPELDQGDYYWHQLQGLQVIAKGAEPLGYVDHLIETGANDVLVVKPDAASIDKRERLIPYLPGQVVEKVDLQAGCLYVDWDPEF